MSRVVLVTGGRLYRNTAVIFRTLDQIHADNPIAHLVHGDADGTDKIAKAWAISRNVPQTPYPIDIAPPSYGNRRGNRRNFIMLEDSKPDLVVRFPGGSGTCHMTELANDRSIPVIEITN